MQSYGIKASLKTRWRDSALYYQLEITPSPPNTIDSFDQAVQSLHEPLRLVLYLYDDSGFEMCSYSVASSDLHLDIGPSGKTKGLNSNSIWQYCSLEHYNDSRKWRLGWKRLPKVPENTSDTAPNENAGVGGQKVESHELKGATALSGVSFMENQVDTESGQSFLIYRRGEQNTILHWEVKNKVHFECKTPFDCIIVNTTREETIHARLIK